MVAVMQGTLWAPHPGRTIEMVGQMAVAKKIHTRLGAKVRAWQIVAGGVNSLQVVYSMQYEDWNAYGKINQALTTDAEWQSFVQTVLNAPNPSAVLVSNNLATALPGLEGSSDPGSGPGPRVSTSRFFEVQQGRQGDARALVTELGAHVGRLGARFRAGVAVFTGPTAGRIQATGEFDDIVAFAAFQARSGDDAAFQAFIANRVQAADSPIRLVAASTRSELPI